MNSERLQYWESKVEWIIAFKNKHGCWPSVNSINTTEKSYAIRIKKLRGLYCKGDLPELLIRNLRKNGFYFAETEAFERKFNELKIYAKVHGCLPPVDHNLN